MTFEEWINHVFDRPLNHWYETSRKPEPLTMAAYLARLFEKPGFLRERFSLDQINQGFDHICGPVSGYFPTALEEPVTPELQEKWIRATWPLYRDLFAKIWPAPPEYRDGGDDSPEGPPFAMRWFWGEEGLGRAATSPAYPHLVAPIFDVLRQILSLDSVACQVSALGGVERLQLYYPARVRELLETYLLENPHIHPQLWSEVEAVAETLVGEDRRPLSFDAWLGYVFDRPVHGEAWYWQEDENGVDLDWWEPEPLTISDYMIQLFENPHVLECYSDEQVNLAIWYMLGPSTCTYRETALRDIVPVERQQRWVRAILPLYRDLFAVRCSDAFGHRNDGPEPPRPLNSACYMFWDLDNFYEIANSTWHKHLVGPVFNTLQEILKLDSLACQESALHGLGHLQESHPERVAQAIRRFLKNSGKLHPHVRAYAEYAMKGYVQ